MAGATDLERCLADAGGPDAAREWSARLRTLLAAELERGERELTESRTGYGTPIVVAVAAADGGVLAALPLPMELRADPGAVGERAGALAAAAVEHVVVGASAGPATGPGDMRLELGDLGGRLVLSYPADAPLEAAEYAHEGLNAEFDERRIDRLRARAQLVPGHALDGVADVRPPIGPTHPLRVAEAVTRLGVSPLDDDAVDELEEPLLRLLGPAGSLARAHEDDDPARRVTRRILQRLDGMGKWGGYHTAFDHLARGFAGNERSLANEVGEALVGAGLLIEKPSVGQRHVSLNPRRSGDIRRLIDEGALPAGLVLP